LLRSNEELQQFACVASHDRQEPLRTVSVYAQLLAARYKGQLQGDADQFISFIVESAERMERLIHDLLDFSRVEARGADFFTKVDCDTVLDDAVRNLRSLIEESGAIVTRERLPVVKGDAIQLTRLFQNLLTNSISLLTNSIRYRSEEAPRIHVAADGGGGEWRFSVRDNGIGIEPQICREGFRYFQVSSAPRQKLRKRHGPGDLPEDREPPRRPHLG